MTAILGLIASYEYKHKYIWGGSLFTLLVTVPVHIRARRHAHLVAMFPIMYILLIWRYRDIRFYIGNRLRKWPSDGSQHHEPEVEHGEVDQQGLLSEASLPPELESTLSVEEIRQSSASMHRVEV